MSAVVVVGGGLAGAWAAITAARAGAEVTLVSRAPGATALYAGAIEIAPDLEAVLANEPYHPFTRLYRDHLKLAADLEEVADSFAAELKRAGLPVTGDARSHGRYPDLHGAPRSAQLVPATVAPGELGGLRGWRSPPSKGSGTMTRRALPRRSASRASKRPPSRRP